VVFATQEEEEEEEDGQWENGWLTTSSQGFL